MQWQDTGLSEHEKRQLVQRVVNSQAFSRAPALCAFLLYVTDHAISGQADKLKEQAIGSEVLGRKPNYNPADDNIVRVRAHELRIRLEKYFAAEGAQEPVTITIPRGAYAPEFAPRKPEIGKTTPTPSEAGVASPAPVLSPVPQEARTMKQYWLLLVAAVLVAALTSVAFTRYAMRSSHRTDLVLPGGATADLWGQFFDRPNAELKIVYADTSFALWQDLSNENLNLGDYLNRQYLNIHGDKLFNVAMRRVTSPADMAITAHLAAMAGKFGGQVTPQFARDVTAEFLHRGDVVLIGSHRSNPWVEVYEPSLNFQLEQDPHSGAPLFRNRSPKTGEAQTYSIPAMFDTQKVQERAYISYGVIALLKSCVGHNLTLIAEGLNTQATQAAGDLVTDPQRIDTLLKSIGHTPGTTVSPFEALIQITSLPGEYDNPKVISFRLRTAQSCIAD